MIMRWTLFVFCIVGFIRNGFPKQQNGCSKFRLKRDSIINTSQSLSNGAKFLSKLIVQSSKECYRRCCERNTCSMGLVHYEKSDSKTTSSLHITKKTCFLFSCGYPSVCVYSDHPDYAAIELLHPEEPSEDLIPTTSLPKKEKGCPPGTPTAMCFANPCEGAECGAFPSATCKPYYCGGCFAHFFDSDDKRVKCQVETNSNEKKDHTNEDLSHKNKQSHEEIVHSEIVHSEEPKPTQPATEEIHERRQWVDNNPNFPTPNWDDWDIKAPKRPKNPSQIKTTTEEEASTPLLKTSQAPEVPTTNEVNVDEKLENIHEKVWKPPTKSKGCPEYKCPVNCEVFFVDEIGCRTCNCVIGKFKKPLKNESKMNVTLLVESKDVVQNSAVVPLIIGLIVSIIMLIVVVVRLKSIKGKLRRRPFATDDADYLINGMYL